MIPRELWGFSLLRHCLPDSRFYEFLAWFAIHCLPFSARNRDEIFREIEFRI